MQNKKDSRYKYTSCTAVVGSMTRAMRAQEALEASAIPCAVVKIEEGRGLRGCVYGLSYSCSQEQNVRATLEAAGISVREWNRPT